jgi:hypothetical protein
MLNRSRARRGSLAAFLNLALASAGVAQQQVMVSPLQALPSANSYSTPLSIAADTYIRMVQRDSVFLTDFALTDGASVDLQLHRVEIFAPDAILVLATQAGDVPMAAPEVALFSGQIVGQPESRVFLAISPEAVNGVVNAASDRYIVSCGPYNQGYQPLIYSVSQTPADLIPVDGFACHYDELVQPGLSKHSAESAAGFAWQRALPDCRYFGRNRLGVPPTVRQ